MKKIRRFIIANLIVLALKIVGGVFLHSNTLLASSLLEVIMIFNSIFGLSKEDKGYKKFISIIYSLSIIGGVGYLNYWSWTNDNLIPSLFILLILLVCLITRYVVLAFTTNMTAQRKNGVLGFATLSTNQDFYNYGVIIGSIIVSKIGKWFGILRYADKVGCSLISLLILFRAIKILINNFRKVDNFMDEYTKEISNRKEITSLRSFKIYSFGGVRNITLEVVPRDNISLVDLSSFIVNLDDYLLKKADTVLVTMGEDNAFRKVINNARNSGSRNGKTNSSRKNTKKKNKKR